MQLESAAAEQIIASEKFKTKTVCYKWDERNFSGKMTVMYVNLETRGTPVDVYQSNVAR